jgi:hypothetical protein
MEAQFSPYTMEIYSDRERPVIGPDPPVAAAQRYARCRWKTGPRRIRSVRALPGPRPPLKDEGTARGFASSWRVSRNRRDVVSSNSRPHSLGENETTRIHENYEQ